MTIAVYPFVGVIAEAVGRLLRLQGTCAAAHVQGRVREQPGERETGARAARRVLRCFIDWGVLRETKGQAVYQAASAQWVKDKSVAVWLIERPHCGQVAQGRGRSKRGFVSGRDVAS